MIGPRSLRLRLTLWYVALLALTLAVFSGGVFLALRRSLDDNLNDTLTSRVDLIRGIVVNDGRLDLGSIDLPGDPVEDEEYVRIYDDAGVLVFDNSSAEEPADLDPDAVQAALAGQRSSRQAKNADETLRVQTAPISGESGVIGVVEAGISEEEMEETLGSLLLIIAIAYPAVLIVTSAGGVFLAGRALAPIDRLTRMARQISAEDLSQRLDLDLPDDEVGRLATTFDEMIARLDEAFRRQRQFTADASHELRTPLTAIKGQAEVALQREREPEEYRRVLSEINSDVDRMIRLIGSLLTMARADAARIPINREQLSLAALVTDAVESFRPAADAKGVALSAAGEEVSLTADQDLLLQLLLNLLANAVEHTPAGGRIDVSWRVREREAVIDVRDTGIGIAAEHLPRIFDRFYRVDPARSRAAGGAGLGLSICRWIAEAHGGRIEARSRPGEGSTFSVHLPAA